MLVGCLKAGGKVLTSSIRSSGESVDGAPILEKELLLHLSFKPLAV